MSLEMILDRLVEFVAGVIFGGLGLSLGVTAIQCLVSAFELLRWK